MDLADVIRKRKLNFGKVLVVDQAFINHMIDRYKRQLIANRDIKPVRQAVVVILELIRIELLS